MQPAVRTVLALAEIKAAIDDFETGEVNAAETMAKILDVCRSAEPTVATREAA